MAELAIVEIVLGSILGVLSLVGIFAVVTSVVVAILASVHKRIVGPLLPLSFYDRDLSRHTFVVTGANAGIGFEVAKALASMRCGRLVMACRSETRAQDAIAEIKRQLGRDEGDSSLEFVPLDLSSFDSIRSFATRLSSDCETIDCLLLNAGVIGLRGTTENGFENHFGINYLGNFLLVQQLLPVLIRSRTRIVNVSSFTHQYPDTIRFESVQSSCEEYNLQRLYNRSKLAIELWTQELQKRLSALWGGNDEFVVVSLCPGVVRTGIVRNYLSRCMCVAKIYYGFGYCFTKSSFEGAQTSIFCALAPASDLVPGAYYTNCTLTPRGGAAVDSPSLQEELWQRSEEWIGESYAFEDVVSGGSGEEIVL